MFDERQSVAESKLIADEDRRMWATEQAMKLLKEKDTKDPEQLVGKLQRFADAIYRVAFPVALP
jgi:hypothetical protein